MEYTIIKTVQDEEFVILNNELEHLRAVVWLVSTLLNRLKTIKSGLSNSVAAVERLYPSITTKENDTHPQKGKYWNCHCWCWHSYIKSNNCISAMSIYIHCQFKIGELSKSIPPIPKYLYDLFERENNEK